jgi:hypothetical protein
MIGRSQRRWARASVRARHVLEKLKAGKWSAMPILRKVRRKRTPSRSDGLQAASEDLKWLAQAANGDSAAVPPYNRSRLIALCLIEVTDDSVAVTDKGKALLSSGKVAPPRAARTVQRPRGDSDSG